MIKTRKPKKERIFFRVTDSGELKPADNYASKLMLEKKYKQGDILAANLSKLRTLGSNKNAHKIADLCRQNIDEFSHYEDSHKILKRLQIESGAACEEIGVNMGGTMHLVRYPLSFSFDSLGEAEFMIAMKTICRYISEMYWDGLDPKKIELMADRMVNE